MYDTTEIFRNPAADIGTVIHSVFSVFFAQPATFLSLAFFQTLSILLSLFLDIVLFGGFFVKLQFTISNCLINNSSRFLLLTDTTTAATTTAVSATARLLDDFYGDNKGPQDDSETCLSEALDDALGEFIGAVLMSAIIFSFIMTIFGNAMIYAATDIYTGVSPSISNSLSKGCKKLCHVFTFQCILGLVIGVAYILIVILPAYAKGGAGMLFLTHIIYLLFVTVLYSVMIAGVPSIVVEGQSPLSAFSRSWNLCKSSIYFIFCSIFCFHVLLSISNIIIKVIQLNTTGFILAIFLLLHFVMMVVMSSLGLILSVVLYFSIRVRSEGYTQTELSSEHGVHVSGGKVEIANEMT